MKQTIKKFGLTTALLGMGLLFNSQVLATEISSDANASAGQSVSIKKDLTLVDMDDASFQPSVPGVTFNYTVSAGTAVTSEAVSDGKGGTVNVPIKAGITTGLNSAYTVVFDHNDTVQTLNNKFVASDKLDIDFKNVTFPEVGIYRYVITETGYTSTDGYSYTTTDLPSLGDENKLRTLDVYVQRDEDGNLTIGGYVLYKKTSTSGDKIKDEGYTYQSEDKITTDNDKVSTSVYHTYDLNVKKVLAGSGADRSLTFGIATTYPMAKNAVYKYTNSNNQTTDLTESAYNASKATTENLGHEKSYKIQGLPLSAKFKVNEADTKGYTASATVDGTNYTLNSQVGYNGDKDGATEVIVTNTKISIPPTGIALMVAPYVAMFALVGAMGVLFFKKRKQ